MLGNTRVLMASLAANLAAHEKDCMAERARLSKQFDELRTAQEASEARIAKRQDDMHADHSRRFDQIQAMSWRVAGVMILTLLSVIGFGLAHLLPLVKI